MRNSYIHVQGEASADIIDMASDPTPGRRLSVAERMAALRAKSGEPSLGPPAGRLSGQSSSKSTEAKAAPEPPAKPPPAAPPPSAPQSQKFESSWTDAQSGGALEYDTWPDNPQFQIWPMAESASYTFELKQAKRGAFDPIGFWIMEADDAKSRQTRMPEGAHVSKSKFTHAPQQTLTITLPRRSDGMPYILVAATYRPGVVGNFTLTVSAEDANQPRIVTLAPPPAAPRKSSSDAGVFGGAATKPAPPRGSSALAPTARAPATSASAPAARAAP